MELDGLVDDPELDLVYYGSTGVGPASEAQRKMPGATMAGTNTRFAVRSKTGEVVSVSPVTATSPSVDPESQEFGDPSSGQSESEVAVGFMNAMNTGDVSVVQRWVMPQARDQVSGWAASTTTVRVYSAFEPGTEYESGDRRIVPITVKLAGQLRGGRDWYPATGESVLNLELESDGADARVANPGSVIWMRDVNFSKLYTQAEVFMAPDLADPSPQLAPVPVFVPTGAQNDAQAPRLRAERALKLLLEGPRGRYDNLSTAIPGGTKLNEFRYADDVATVNLSHSFSRPEGPGQVRVGQIGHVDVVADARSVRCRVVVAEQGERLPALDRRQHGRDQVGLGIVVLADRIGRTGHVEVAQGHATEPVRPAVPGERAFERTLRLAIRVDRPGLVVLADRRPQRQAVDRRGR